MTPMIETTRRKMFEHLASMKAQRKHPRLTAFFEDALEAHLETLRIERERDVMVSGELLEYREILRDAYDRQKQLTHSACVSYRELEDEHREQESRMRQISIQHDDMLSDHTSMAQTLRDATAKLASQTQTIIALHRVVKDQQSAQASLQGRISDLITAKNREQAESYSSAALAQSEIMRLESYIGKDSDLLDSKQKLIVSQRKAIESLTFELASARKQAQKRSFWTFWKRKPAQAKKIPK